MKEINNLKFINSKLATSHTDLGREFTGNYSKFRIGNSIFIDKNLEALKKFDSISIADIYPEKRKESIDVNKEYYRESLIKITENHVFALNGFENELLHFLFYFEQESIESFLGDLVVLEQKGVIAKENDRNYKYSVNLSTEAILNPLANKEKFKSTWKFLADCNRDYFKVLNQLNNLIDRKRIKSALEVAKANNYSKILN